MNYIKLTSENLDSEHICCAISSNKDIQVGSKKAWLREQFEQGLTFLKADIRGKCFIEYIPAENAWVPIEADTAEPFFNLMYLPFTESAAVPRFKEQVKTSTIKKKGFVLYYSYGCPFTAKYVPLIEEIAKNKDVPFESIKIDSRKMAQNSPALWTNYSLFYDGKYVTNEILSEKKFLSIYEKLCKN